MTPREKAYIEARKRLMDNLCIAGWCTSTKYVEGQKGEIALSPKGQDKFEIMARLLIELGYAPESMTAEDGRAFGEILHALLWPMPPREGRSPSEYLR